MLGIAMPDWRSGVIASVKAGEEVEEAVEHIMRSCGVSTLNPAELPRYKLSCIDVLLRKYNYKSTIYLTDIYGIVNAKALRLGIGREVLFKRAWSYLSTVICNGVNEAECDKEVNLACCVRKCGKLCELAKFEAFTRRGIVVDLTKKLEEILDVSQNI